MISETLEYAELFEALSTAEVQIGRKIEPVLVTRAEWELKLGAKDPFAGWGDRRIVTRVG